MVAQTFAVIARRSNTSELTFNKTRQHFCEKYAFIEKLENLLFVYKVINNDTESATAFCYVSLNSIIKSNIEQIVFPHLSFTLAYRLFFDLCNIHTRCPGTSVWVPAQNAQSAYILGAPDL